MSSIQNFKAKHKPKIFRMILLSFVLLVILPFDVNGFKNFNDGKKYVMAYGVDLMVFTSPIYLGLLGLLVGILVKKLKKKK